MAYSNFTLSKVKADFGIVTDETQDLFVDVAPIQPSEILKLVLKEQLPLASAINTEKARSELVIMPVLLEVRRQLSNQIAIFSGTTFEVDPAKGLEGRTDFILSRSPEQYYIAAPVVTIIEAKNENIPSGLGQCIATQHEGQTIQAIYGAVTTGNEWKFLKLVHKTAFIDTNNYFIKEVDKILGIFAISLDDKQLQ